MSDIVSFKELLDLKHKRKRANILCLDIETFPLELYGWGMFNQNFGINQIKDDWSLMSFSAEWLHHPGNFYTDNRHADHPKDDHLQLVLLHRLLDETDFVLARNGKKFDARKIKARLVQQGFPPVRPVKMIDPMLLNKVEFAFTSQKLEYTTGVLVPELRKSSHSKYPGFELWRACLANDPIAWQECEDYNRTDVRSMKAEYLKMRGWYTQHPNLAIFGAAHDGHTCGTCGSHRVVKDGLARTQVGVYQRYRCKSCHKYSRGRKLLASQEDRAHVLVSA